MSSSWGRVFQQTLECFKCGGEHWIDDCTSFAIKLKKVPSGVTQEELANRFPTAMKVDYFTTKFGAVFYKLWYRTMDEANLELSKCDHQGRDKQIDGYSYPKYLVLEQGNSWPADKYVTSIHFY
jgi:hypothetical protein